MARTIATSSTIGNHMSMIGFVICIASMYGLATVRSPRQLIAWLVLFVIGMACGVVEATT